MCGQKLSYADLEKKIQRLEELHATNQAIFNAIPGGICIISPEEVILEVNPAYCEQTKRRNYRALSF